MPKHITNLQFLYHHSNFYLPEVGSGLEAAGTPRPAKPSHTGEYSKHQLGGSQRIEFNCNPHLAGLVPWFESQPLILQTPSSAPKRVSPGRMESCDYHMCHLLRTSRNRFPLPHGLVRDSCTTPSAHPPWKAEEMCTVPGMLQSNLNQHQLNHQQVQTGARELSTGISHPVLEETGYSQPSAMPKITPLHSLVNYLPHADQSMCWSFDTFPCTEYQRSMQGRTMALPMHNLPIFN